MKGTRPACWIGEPFLLDGCKGGYSPLERARAAGMEWAPCERVQAVLFCFEMD